MAGLLDGLTKFGGQGGMTDLTGQGFAMKPGFQDPGALTQAPQARTPGFGDMLKQYAPALSELGKGLTSAGGSDNFGGIGQADAMGQQHLAALQQMMLSRMGRY